MDWKTTRKKMSEKSTTFVEMLEEGKARVEISKGTSKKRKGGKQKDV